MLKKNMEFGVWKVISDECIRDKHKHPMYKVRCVCGNEFYKIESVITGSPSSRTSCKCKGPKYLKCKVGSIYGTLTVIEINITKYLKESNGIIHKRNYARVECDCGKVKEVLISNLKDNSTCGCTRLGARKENARKRHPLYHAWKSMIRRCTVKSDPNWKDYGKRGITVCEEFMDFDKYVAFVGPKRKPGLTVDRIDVNGNYEPGNIRLATYEEQGNNKRNSTVVEDVFAGDSLTISRLARRYGISRDSLRKRYEKGLKGIELLNVKNNYYHVEWTFLNDDERNHIRDTLANNPIEQAATLLGIKLLDALIIHHFEVLK